MGRQFNAEKSTAANKGVAIAGVPCFADSLVQGGSSVLRMKFSAKTPRHRKPPARWWQAYKNETLVQNEYIKHIFYQDNRPASNN